MNKADKILADKVIANHLLLERFSAGEKKRVLEILREMQKELKAKLLTGLTDFSRARMLKVLNQCTAIINEYYSGIQTKLDLTGLAKTEMDATQKVLVSIGIDASVPATSVLKSMISDTLLQGAPLKDWWAKQSDDLAFKFASQVRQGVAQSETLQEIITRIVGSQKKGIAGIMEISWRNASTLVHDSIMQIANNARMEVYKANDDINKGYRHLSTLDSRSCLNCAARDGAEWDIDYKPVKGSFQFQNPPIHANCRCLLLPVLKSYRELGLDVDEMKTGTRASDLGQVPADTSFDAFLKRHDDDYLDELLGPGRANLYRSGKITLRDLVSGDGRVLTLEQLKKAA